MKVAPGVITLLSHGENHSLITYPCSPIRGLSSGAWNRKDKTLNRL